MFRRNVGGLDRILRVTFGPILVLAGLVLLTGKTSVGLVITLVGVLALITGITRFCVLYIPLGISTARSKELRQSYLCDCITPAKQARLGRDKSTVVADAEDHDAILTGNPSR